MAATRITRARFTLSPFTSDQMRDLGNTVLLSVKKRIHAGLTVEDSPAKPLKGVTAVSKGGSLEARIPYATQKQQKGLQGIRDLMKTGGLMASIQVLSCSEDKAILGSNNPLKDRVLHKNNKVSAQFGMSPTDTKAMQKKVGELLRLAISITTK